MIESCRRVSVGHLYSTIQRCGGVEQVLEDLVTGIPDSEVKQTLFLLRRLPTKEEREFPSHIRIWPARPWNENTIRHVRKFKRTFDLIHRCNLALAILRSGIDILHIHRGSEKSHALTAFLARLAGIRVIRTVHRDPSQDPFIGKYLRPILRLIDAWVVLAPEHADALEQRGIQKDSVFVIPNGIQYDAIDRFSRDSTRVLIRQSLGIPSDVFVCISVARLDLSQKDFFTLLQAFFKVVKQIPDAWLVIAGEGSGRREIESLVAQLGLGSRVLLLGYRKDVRRLMVGADVLVFSTRYEGLPLVAAEAMSVALPVVASDVAGLRFVLDYGNAGVLVPPGDADAMSKAICELAGDSERRHHLAGSGRERVEQEFGREAMLARYQALWENCVRTGRGSPS